MLNRLVSLFNNGVWQSLTTKGKMSRTLKREVLSLTRGSYSEKYNSIFHLFLNCYTRTLK
jgi:hypothetical protein